MRTEVVEHYEIQNGQAVLVKTETVELPFPSQEEEIAEKEAQLLSMYNELQELKNNSAE